MILDKTSSSHTPTIDSELRILKDKTILAIQDNPYIRYLSGDLLENNEIYLVIASDLEEGIELFKQLRENINIIIIDTEQNLKQSLGAAREIRKIKESVPILLLTNSTQREEAHTQWRESLSSILEKPFPASTFFEALCEIVQRKTRFDFEEDE